MQPLLIGAILVLLFSGCERKAVVAPIAAAAPQPKPIPPLAIRPADFAEPASGDSVPLNSAWDLKIAWVPVEKIEPLGLKDFFSTVPETNSVARAELARSPLHGLARTYTNVLLSVHEGTHAGTSSSAVASNLVDRLNKASGVDIMMPPPLNTIGTNEARGFVMQNQTIVVTTTPSGAPVTTNVSLGSQITMRTICDGKGSIQVETAIRLDLFNGYGRDPTNPDESLDRPAPMLDVAALGTRTVIASSDVLLLGGPVQTNVTVSVDRAKYLSDIPGLGRFFTKVHVQTNRFRTLVIIQKRGE